MYQVPGTGNSYNKRMQEQCRRAISRLANKARTGEEMSLEHRDSIVISGVKFSLSAIERVKASPQISCVFSLSQSHRGRSMQQRISHTHCRIPTIYLRSTSRIRSDGFFQRKVAVSATATHSNPQQRLVLPHLNLAAS